MVIVGVFDNMTMNIEDCINTLIDMDKIYPVEYEAISMAITALEYRKPMKVKYNDKTDEYSCPHCASNLMKTEIIHTQDENMDGEWEYYDYEEIVPSFVDYCPDCGQALDWNRSE